MSDLINVGLVVVVLYVGRQFILNFFLTLLNKKDKVLGEQAKALTNEIKELEKKVSDAKPNKVKDLSPEEIEHFWKDSDKQE